MDKEQIITICKRVNGGEKLKDICKEFNISVEQMESIIKSYGYKKSSILDIYYDKKYKEKIRKYELQEKCNQNMDLVEKLWLKRYRGIDIDIYDGVLDENEEFADEPWVTTKIDLNYELYSELEELAESEGTPLSIYIEKMLLQMLERNKETRLHTKGRKKYIKTMVDGTICEEFAEEVIKDLDNKDFIKFKDITYKNTLKDIKIYIANYLINKGYTLEQVEKAASEDNDSLYDEDYCCEKFELHYDYIHSGECKTFEEVEKMINK